MMVKRRLVQVAEDREADRPHAPESPTSHGRYAEMLEKRLRAMEDVLRKVQNSLILVLSLSGHIAFCS